MKQVDRVEQLERLLKTLNRRDALVEVEDGLGGTALRSNRVDDRPQVPQARLLRLGGQNPKVGGTIGALGQCCTDATVFAERLE